MDPSKNQTEEHGDIRRLPPPTCYTISRYCGNNWDMLEAYRTSQAVRKLLDSAHTGSKIHTPLRSPSSGKPITSNKSLPSPCSLLPVWYTRHGSVTATNGSPTCNNDPTIRAAKVTYQLPKHRSLNFHVDLSLVSLHYIAIAYPLCQWSSFSSGAELPVGGCIELCCRSTAW